MASISFVCPLFNKEAYLPGVIEALARQAPDHARQFVFIDDGSSDRSLEVVRALTADWPDCVYHRQDNQGPSGATNAGFARADGDYIKLLGSDDILAPFATDLLLRVLDETGAVAVYSIQSYYRSPAEIAFADAAGRAGASLLDDPVRAAIRHTISGTSQTLFRGDAVRAAGGCDPRVFAEDFSLALRLALQGPIATLPVVTAFGPAGEGERIMVGRKHQVFHDYNLALFLFLKDHPALKARLGRLALARAAGRAEKWVSRERKGDSFLGYSLLRLAACLPGLDHAGLIERTLPAFTGGAPARVRPIVRPGA